ncbi:MAG: acid phosphatase [Candidatus Eremiobacteraeota bacterium]|nr:acid phosphatase [Candidatus Eremiobacteraeota bacterium]
MAHYRCSLFALLLGAALALSGCNGNSSTVPSAQPNSLASVNHILVIYQENWSFDALYGGFPGANGVPLGTAVKQVAVSGTPITVLPQALNYAGNPDPRFPASLPVATFNAARYVSPTGMTGDLIHRFYHEQLQIAGGSMDKFVAWSDNPGLVLSQYDATALALPEEQLAAQYVLGDNTFHSAFGGSFLNHQFLICACAPRWPNAPANYISDPDPNHLNDNHVTPDRYAVNTSYSVYKPHPAGIPTSNLVPPQTQPTIGDRLSAAGVSWKWYAGGWNNALAGNPDPNFQFHHQPFVYYKNFADGTPAKAAHLQDEANFGADIAAGNLPSVAFIKPIGENNEHPGYAALLSGQQHVANLVNLIRNSPYWNDTIIIITYDENGGRWDHVAPPIIDRWGPGSRVPLIIVSKFAKTGFVDHTPYETDSILALIEKRFNLQPLGSHDANANPFSNAFTF